jgi:hypothetical protein
VPVALSGYTAFVATGAEVQVVDTTTGRVVGSVRALDQVPNPVGAVAGLNGAWAAAPLIAGVQGGPVALAGYVVELPGQGTTPPALALEVDAVTVKGNLAWRTVAPLPGKPGQVPELNGNPDADFIGMAGTTAVMTIGDDQDGYTTMAFDLVDHKLLWQSASFLAEAVVGSKVIGTADTSTSFILGSGQSGSDDTVHLAGVSLTQGKTEWQRPEDLSQASVQEAAPGKILVEADGVLSGGEGLALLDAATGKNLPLSSQAGNAGLDPEWTCAYAGKSVVVCNEASTANFAIDGITGKVLWQLPDTADNRTSLLVTAVFDGLVYGRTSSGPVVLNAETGADVNDSPGVAPLVLDPDVGIASTDAGGLQAYPAA